jgi:hypothetical protein
MVEVVILSIICHRSHALTSLFRLTLFFTPIRSNKCGCYLARFHIKCDHPKRYVNRIQTTHFSAGVPLPEEGSKAQ